MADDPANPDDPQDGDIEREIRRRRGFSIAGALAGRDGGGHLKGASPTPMLQRAALDLGHWLDDHLPDAEGALRNVVRRAVSGRPDILQRHADDPAAAVAEWLPTVLASPTSLAELVRQADVEWGRLYQERPHFERDGADPHPDDPYTREGVRAQLERLLARARG